MTWYNDPDSGPPPSNPLPPPGAPPPFQQPPQAQPTYQQPAYQQPPYQQPMPGQQPPYQQGPPAPPAGPNGGKGGKGESLKKTLAPLRQRNVLIALAGCLVAILVVGGGYLLLSGPDEMATREYARLVCTDVLKPAAKSFDTLIESRDFERVTEGDVNTQRDAERAIVAVRDLTDLYRQTAVKVEAFNSSHVLRGHDGEDFQVEMTEAVNGFLPAIDQARNDVDDLDPADEEDIVDDIRDILQDVDGLDVSLDQDDAGGELYSALSNRSDDCALMFVRLVNQESEGD